MGAQRRLWEYEKDCTAGGLVMCLLQCMLRDSRICFSRSYYVEDVQAYVVIRLYNTQCRIIMTVGEGAELVDVVAARRLENGKHLYAGGTISTASPRCTCRSRLLWVELWKTRKFLILYNL